MATETVTFNKDNWSGEMHTLEIQDGCTFTLHEYQFHLVFDEDGESAEVTSPSWHYPLFKLLQFETASGQSVWYASKYGVEREDANPAIAACKLLFMIL